MALKKSADYFTPRRGGLFKSAPGGIAARASVFGVSDAFDEATAAFLETHTAWLASEKSDRGKRPDQRITPDTYLEAAKAYGVALGQQAGLLMNGDFTLLEHLINQEKLRAPLTIESRKTSIHVPATYMFNGLNEGLAIARHQPVPADKSADEWILAITTTETKISSFLGF